MTISLPIYVVELESDSYHLMIDLEFSEGLKGSLIIDTGASKTVFDANFVESIVTNLEEVEDQDSSGINAMILQTKVGTIPMVKFGELEVVNQPWVLLDLFHVNKVYKKRIDKQIVGLLGSDFMVDYNAIIDYGQLTLTLDYTSINKS